METQEFTFFTGGLKIKDGEFLGRLEEAPLLAQPDKLQPSANLTFYWGIAEMEARVTGCSLRELTWDQKKMMWLHCKGTQTCDFQNDGSGPSLNVLVPAIYVTRFDIGGTYQQVPREGGNKLVGVFPPRFPVPIDALSLETIQQMVEILRVKEP